MKWKDLEGNGHSQIEYLRACLEGLDKTRKASVMIAGVPTGFELGTSQIQGSCYRLHSPEFESWWKQDFPYLSRLAARNIQHHVQQVMGVFPRSKMAEVWC